MTMSIAGRCERTGALGAAISSSSIAVRSRCVWARAHTGVVLTQSVTDPRLGLMGLRLLGHAYGARAVVEELQRARPHSEWRQLGVLDADGATALFSGARTLGVHAGATGNQCLAAGNLLADESVPQAMVEAFTSNGERDLPSRLLTALEAGLHQGGEAGPLRSAGLLVYGDEAWPRVDLRVDWHDEPIELLARLWSIYEPQMNDYLLRSRSPGDAPGYGVPGEQLS
jgi:uncharacterized Ntn-hydrolase superfamily protein